MAQTSAAFSNAFSGRWETGGNAVCWFNFSFTTSSIVVLICFQNSAGAIETA
jgi:hypothetical protein